MTEIMPVPRNSNITVLRPPSIQKVALVFQRVQIMIVLINKSILQIKLATQEKMICLEKSNQT